MGARVSKEEILKDVEAMQVDAITKMSADMNHRLFKMESELSIAKNDVSKVTNDLCRSTFEFSEKYNCIDKQLKDLQASYKMLSSSIAIQNQEVEILHRVKKNKESKGWFTSMKILPLQHFK